ncbi:MAG: hypothetical protein J0L69_14540 [Bacteroidetes bacterium]|nr:hypothetical protein [Bacteroidota bacterium]
MIKIIEKYGFFRLTLIPLGVVIIISAIINGIWGMGVVGLIVLIFGLMNKCLLLGNCEIPIRKNKNSSEQ